MPLLVSPPIVTRARESLRLRAALLPLLSNAELTPSERDVLLGTPSATWRFVVYAECCALGVGDALRRAGLRDLLPADTRAELEAAELRETQRVVAARSVLRTVDELAHRVGASVVVVKGGVAAVDAGRRPVDLGDVDVLAAPDQASALWEALRSAGWTPEYEGLGPHDRAALRRNHFAPLRSPSVGLPIELHHNLDYGDASSAVGPDDTTPIAGTRALRRLRHGAALVMLLRHTVVKHPFRRGHLRDLLLFTQEVVPDDPPDFREIERSFASDRYAPELVDMLHQVEAMSAGRRRADSPATRRFIAWKYGTILGAGWTFGERLPGWSSIGHTTLERPEIRRAEYRSLFSYAFQSVPEDSRFRTGALGRRLLPVSHGALWVIWASYRIALALLLGVSAPYVRRSVAAVAEPDPDAATAADPVAEHLSPVPAK